MGNEQALEKGVDEQELKETDIFTHNAASTSSKSDIICIPVTKRIAILGALSEKKEQRIVYALYAKHEKLSDVFDAVKKAFYPLKMTHPYFGEGSFTCHSEKLEVSDTLLNTPITAYDRKKIVELGLKVDVRPVFELTGQDVEITCPSMMKGQACPIYREMIEQYAFTENNLAHLQEYTHFRDELEEKPRCRYQDNCKTFKRMEIGGNRLDDRCHLKLYRHPPRARNLTLSKNVHAFIMNANATENKDFSSGFRFLSPADGDLKALIHEVITNGFKNDLCLQCGPKDKSPPCPHSDYSILTVVDEKMKHIRHRMVGSPLRRHEMLALVLYTGCDCNYDLCASQRSGDYQKWKIFDHSLHFAIQKLAMRENPKCALYSGLKKVKIHKKSIKEGYFVTYVSTSWNKNVSQDFMGDGGGMIIKFDQDYFGCWVYCCDVSWVSKFQDECEVLFARSVNHINDKAFECEVIDDSKGVQTVLLKPSKVTINFSIESYHHYGAATIY